MSEYRDRREARRYEVSDLDLQAPLAIVNGKIGLRISPKTPISVGPDGLRFNFDPDAGAIAPGSPWQYRPTVELPLLNEVGAPEAAVDFAQEQALQFVIENRTSDPVSPVTGQIWLRTDL